MLLDQSSPREGGATSLHPKKKTKKESEFWFFEYLKDSLTKAQKVRAANANVSEFREGSSNNAESLIQVSTPGISQVFVFSHSVYLIPFSMKGFTQLPQCKMSIMINTMYVLHTKQQVSRT